MLLEQLQLALRAPVVPHQLLGAQGDSQQARLVEDVTGVAEALQLVAVVGEHVLGYGVVAVAGRQQRCQVECVAWGCGAAVVGEQWVELLVGLRQAAGVQGRGVRSGAGLDRRLAYGRGAGRAVGPAAVVLAPPVFAVSWAGPGPQGGGSLALRRPLPRVGRDSGVGLEDRQVVFWLGVVFGGGLHGSDTAVGHHRLEEHHLGWRHHLHGRGEGPLLLWRGDGVRLQKQHNL